MSRNLKSILGFGIIFFIAAFLRLPHLSSRPMHTDEAVHGMKLCDMLAGKYRYDPVEYHGPTLNLFTIPVAWIQGQTKCEQITETTLRLVPAILGLITIILIWGLRTPLGNRTVCLITLFLAISPVFVFFCRYYIQEIPLVFFTVGAIVCAYQYTKHPSVILSILIGFFLGLMHATKETWILSLAALILSSMIMRFLHGYRIPGFQKKHGVYTLGCMLLISALIYSHFFTYPKGIADSFISLSHYLKRGSGQTLHIHPWYYYFQLLLYHHQIFSGPVFTETVIFIFGIFGIVFSFIPKYSHLTFIRFMVYYTLILTLIYVILPYKTPWSLLSFWKGWIVLAGFGVHALIVQLKKPVCRTAFCVFFLIGTGHLAYQNRQIYHHASDPRLPWTYAHPDQEIFKLEATLRQVASGQPEGKNIYIQIIYPNSDYWPLPWMLRDFHRVGWWDHVDMATESAPVILIAPDLESALVRKLYELPPPGKRHLYVPLFDELIQIRPGAPVEGYIQKNLWDQIYG